MEINERNRPDSQERLDAVLVKRSLASGREKAKALIRAGLVTVNGRPVNKPAFFVGAGDEVACAAEGAPRHVSRGGLKLEKALQLSGLSPAGRLCLDVGASTGGFTDCMLQNGANRVIALDVGHGQLHDSLCADPRVINLEGTDIRDEEKIGRILAPASVQFCSIDVSFISIEKIWPWVRPWLAPGASVVILVKPQFEAGREAVGKRGVVRDAHSHRAVLERFVAFLPGAGLGLRALTYSPVTGGEGNIEYLAAAVFGGESRCRPSVRQLVEESHAVLLGKRD